MGYSIREMEAKGLIRRIPPSLGQARESMAAAGSWGEEAEKVFHAKSYKSCLLIAYLAMFHAARSVLFAKGYREKSHLAVVFYLEDACVRTGSLEEKWVALLDHYREQRNHDQYGSNVFVSENEAKEALKKAHEFVERIALLLAKMEKKR